MAVTLLFWRQSPIGITVVALMCGGDGLADLIGRKYGSAKLPFNQNKSWAGSLAMFFGNPPSLPTAYFQKIQSSGLYMCSVASKKEVTACSAEHNRLRRFLSPAQLLCHCA